MAADRDPSAADQSNDLAVTVLTMRAMQLYPPRMDRAAATRAVERAAAWLAARSRSDNGGTGPETPRSRLVAGKRDRIRGAAATACIAADLQRRWAQGSLNGRRCARDGEALARAARERPHARCDPSVRRGIESSCARSCRTEKPGMWRRDRFRFRRTSKADFHTVPINGIRRGDRVGGDGAGACTPVPLNA